MLRRHQRPGARDYSQYRGLVCQRQSIAAALTRVTRQNHSVTQGHRPSLPFQPKRSYSPYGARGRNRKTNLRIASECLLYSIGSIEDAARDHAHISGDTHRCNLTARGLDLDAYLAGPTDEPPLV